MGVALGFNEAAILSLTWIAQFAAGCFLIVGFFSRPSAIVAWFLHLCATKSATLFPYGMDSFVTIGLFYLMISPLPDRYSADHRFRHLPTKNPCLFGFFRRILQLHLCLIYFFAGITKCLGSGWWDGSNMWRVLTRPSFDIISPDVLVRLQPLLIVAGIIVCLTEIGYPIVIWFRRTRLVWFSAILGHAPSNRTLFGNVSFCLRNDCFKYCCIRSRVVRLWSGNSCCRSRRPSQRGRSSRRSPTISARLFDRLLASCVNATAREYYMASEVKTDSELEIAHVLFIDTVGYSKLRINEQRELLDELNRIVRATHSVCASEAAGKLIRIPTGDGMALVFSDRPDAPAKCALEISLASKQSPHFLLRMGIHSGPVSRIMDVNDRANAAGAGINIAQRVMSCGDAGHILLSKHAADDLIEYERWRPFLHEIGEDEVKHEVRIGSS